MSDDVLRQVAGELNKAPSAAERAPRMATLVVDTNTRIATEAINMPFDSSPYAYQTWLKAVDKN